MLVPERHAQDASDKYRFGFNGMEKDDDIKGDGNSYTTDFRQYDPRIGRWLSTDPLSYKLSNQSPYNYCFNNPLYYSDEYGNIPYPVALKYIKKFVWGKQAGMGTVQEFGWRQRQNRMHWGLDFNIGSQSEDLGIELLSMADGVVIFSGWSNGGGNTIIIKHGNGYITRLFHMKDASLLRVNDKVNEGDVVGAIGKTGGNYAVHGHLEIAKIDNENASNEEALKLFKTYKFHIDPREIVGQGAQGDGQKDLQILSTKGKEVAYKENLSEKFPSVVQDNIRTVKPKLPERGTPHPDTGYFWLKTLIENNGAPEHSVQRDNEQKEKKVHKSPRTF